MLPPEDGALNDPDVCIALSNLIDNATEAFRGLKNTRIDIRLKRVKEYLTIVVENTIAQDVLRHTPQLRAHKRTAEPPQIGWDIRRELKKNAPAGILSQYRRAQIPVNPLKVMYVESNLKTQVIHLTDGRMEVNCRLKKLEPLFLPFGFVKTHNSFLVNYRFIASIRKGDLPLPIGKHRLGELEKACLALIMEE